MKTTTFAQLSVAVTILASTAVGLAQTPAPPVGEVPEPPSSPPATATRRAVSFVATLTPLGNDDMTSGGVIFIPAGDDLNVIGRIGGMEPNRRYEIALLPAGMAVTGLTPGVDSPAGKPGINTPASGVTGAELPAGVDLGMLTADANGAAIWDATLRRNELAKFPASLAGCTVVIRRAPPLDTPAERRPVASGQVVAIPTAVPAPYR